MPVFKSKGRGAIVQRILLLMELPITYSASITHSLEKNYGVYIKMIAMET